MIEQRVLQAALELQALLRDAALPYCFIGGIAVQRWGRPRFTNDADATVLTRFIDDERVTDLLLAEFEPRRPDARSFALLHRVVLLRSRAGTGIDVALGTLPFEANSIERSSEWRLPDGQTLRTCSAEDLIVHKAFAARDLDWADVDHILMRQGTALNVDRILDELRPLVELKQAPEILERLAALLRKRRIID